MDSETTVRTTTERHNHLVGGGVLITIGLWMLLSRIVEVDLGAAVPVGLGLIFLVWGSLSRKVGLLIPGGILTGIGTGALLLLGPLSGLEGEAAGGAFFLVFAGGWALITLCSVLFVRQALWWPLIPGGFLAFFGSALLVGGPALGVLEALGQAWPVVLIALGLYVILWRKGLRR